MAQAKVATPPGKLSSNHGESVQQKTGVGVPTKAIASARIQSKYVSIGGDPVLLFDNKSNDLHPAIYLLTVTQAAELLKISVTSMRRLQQGRHIPFIKVGGSVRFAMCDIESYLGKRRVESIDQ